MSSRERMKQTLEQMAFPVYEGRDRQVASKGEASALAVIFLGSDIDLEDSLKRLKQWRASGRPMIFVFSEASQRVLQVAQITKKLKPMKVITDQPHGAIKALLAETAQVYVPNLTQNTAAKLACGIQDNFATNLLWQALALGKIVHANAAGIDKAWVDLNGNPAMAMTMQRHMETLKSYGVLFEAPCYTAEPLQSANGEPGLGKQKGNGKGYVTLKDELSLRVVTEHHILSLEKGSRLAVRKGAKVTPLAKETARKRQIELLQMEEGNNL